MSKITINPDSDWVKEFKKELKANSGHCPCKLIKNKATKRYVDSVMSNHLVDIDPHGFMTILNQRLALYYKKSDTYSKAETYSRAQIDSIINSLVVEA